MKRIKATAEIKALKNIIREQNQKIINLNAQIYELENQLKESKSKEGKGCLEKAIDAIGNMFSSIDFSKLIEMHPDILEIDSQEDDNAI